MDPSTSTYLGKLKSDGTIELTERPALPAGQVEVTIRPIPRSEEGENWLACVERIRARREASGYPFRTKEEIIAEIEELRSEWDSSVEILP